MLIKKLLEDYDKGIITRGELKMLLVMGLMKETVSEFLTTAPADIVEQAIKDAKAHAEGKKFVVLWMEATEEQKQKVSEELNRKYEILLEYVLSLPPLDLGDKNVYDNNKGDNEGI